MLALEDGVGLVSTKVQGRPARLVW